MVFSWLQKKKTDQSSSSNRVSKGVSRLTRALSQVKNRFITPFKKLLGHNVIDDETIENLEELLYEADFSSTLVSKLIESVRYVKNEKVDITTARIQALTAALIQACQLPSENSLSTSLDQIYQGKWNEEGKDPFVMFVIGINGSGKTTSMAKLAAYYKSMGKSVLVAAADTFRAAAVNQLQTWSTRVGVEICSLETKDPSAVVFEACQRARNENFDVLLIDTAGRWHNREPLMQELSKMQRVAQKQLGHSIATLLIMDAVIGQNALTQARSFLDLCQVNAMMLTKVDGGAKGGAALSILEQMHLPIAFLGTGEGIDDLDRFDLTSFVKELFSP